jgi:hypothetical protein
MGVDVRVGDPQPEASMEIRPIWAVGIEEQNLNVAVLENHELRMRS